MSQEQTELLMLKGLISDLTPQEQLDVKLMIEVMTDLLREKPAAAILGMTHVMLQAQITPQAFGLPG